MPDTARHLGARLREAVTSRASLDPIVLDLHLYPRVVEQRGLVDAVDEMRKHITFRAREGDTFEIAFEGTTPDEVQEVTRRLAGSIVKEATVRRAERARTLKEFVDAESERTNAELKVKEGALASFLAAIRSSSAVQALTCSRCLRSRRKGSPLPRWSSGPLASSGSSRRLRLRVLSRYSSYRGRPEPRPTRRT